MDVMDMQGFQQKAGVINVIDTYVDATAQH